MNKFTMVLLALFITGCGNANNGVVGQKIGFDGHVMEFKTRNGIYCVFAKAGYGGGLSCNWNELK